MLAAPPALAALDFTGILAPAGLVGAVSRVKIIRSMMVKGMAALAAECAIAATRAGVLDDVSAVDVSMNGIELQDRELVAAIRAGRESNASVARVLPC